MSRYVAMAHKPRAWVSDQEPAMGDRPTNIVHETDKSPEPTGLVDAHGTPLYRVMDTIKMGYRP